MKHKVVGFLAREHGLAALEALIEDPHFEVITVFTHRLNPLSMDSMRRERREFSHFQQTCHSHRIPLFPVDTKREAQEITGRLEPLDFDLIACVSWRRLILSEHLKLPRHGGINVHRGKLPTYAGAEPIKKALLHGETEIVITAHVLAEEIDAGPVIKTTTHPTNVSPHHSIDENVDRLKKEITPLFGPLLVDALKTLTS